MRGRVWTEGAPGLWPEQDPPGNDPGGMGFKNHTPSPGRFLSCISCIILFAGRNIKVSSTKMAVKKSDDILIIGAGVFGLSTALELTKRGYTKITVLDRHVPPVVDGSSVDISRIIRADYAHPVYAQMALEAYKGWTSTYSGFYHESGFILLSETPENPYLEGSKQNILAKGGYVDEFSNISEMSSIYPSIEADLPSSSGYHNPVGGWADAAGSISHLAS